MNFIKLDMSRYLGCLVNVVILTLGVDLCMFVVHYSAVDKCGEGDRMLTLRWLHAQPTQCPINQEEQYQAWVTEMHQQEVRRRREEIDTKQHQWAQSVQHRELDNHNVVYYREAALDLETMNREAVIMYRQTAEKCEQCLILTKRLSSPHWYQQSEICEPCLVQPTLITP